MKTAVLSFILCCAMLSAAVKQPTFFARRDYTSAGGSVVVGDVTGDGIPDIVAVHNLGYVSTLIGNGDGTFRDAVWSPSAGSRAGSWIGPALVDLNGDGRMDLVTGGLTGGLTGISGGINVFFSNGDGTFQDPVAYPVNDAGVGNAVVGDFNGDGIPDVISPGLKKGIWLFTGKGGGTFNAGVLIPMTAGVHVAVAADFNGDGKLDIAVLKGPGALYVLFGNGNGTFQTPVLVDAQAGRDIVAGPLTRNGLPGILIVSSSVKIYLGNSSGAFSGPFLVPSFGAFWAAIGDVNGDGIPDLVSSEGCVVFGLGDVKFGPPFCYATASTGPPPPQYSYSVALAELTQGAAAGHNDIVLGRLSTVSVLLNRGKSNGTFIDGVWTSAPASLGCGATADFNGDGKPDLALSTRNGVVILLGTGKTFAPYATGETLPSSTNFFCPVTGDVNGDGIPDLLVWAQGLNGTGVYLGQGDGTFLLASMIPFNAPNYLVLADFNHDGKLDVAASSNQFALGNGDGTFQTPSPILANPPPHPGLISIAAGDVNNDGWPDLVATYSLNSTSGGSLYVMLNNQQGGFTLATTIKEAAALSEVTLADLRGNGNLDAVVNGCCNKHNNSTARIYLGNGHGGFTSGQMNIPYPFVDALPPQIGDVNGDGIPDLLLGADFGIGIALGTGKGTFYEPFVVGAGPHIGQVLMQNLRGQSASAGLPDLVTPNWDYSGAGGVMVLYNLTK